MHLFHGTNALIDQPRISDNGQSNTNANGHDLGFGLYLADTPLMANRYGTNIYGTDVKLGKELSLFDITLTKDDLTKLIWRLYDQFKIDFVENYHDTINISPSAYHGLIYYNVVPALLDADDNDVDIVNGIANANDCCQEVATILSQLGYTHCQKDHIYVLYDLSKITNWKLTWQPSRSRS